MAAGPAKTLPGEPLYQETLALAAGPAKPLRDLPVYQAALPAFFFTKKMNTRELKSSMYG